jgi:Carboxypeptidase regulatory-like domain
VKNIFLKIALLIVAISASIILNNSIVIGQSSSVSAGSDDSQKAKSEAEKKLKAQRLKTVRAAILASRKAPQDDKPIVTQPAFQGVSDSLESIAKQNLPPVSKENSKTNKDEIAMEAILQLKKEAGYSTALGPIAESFLQTQALTPSAAVAGTSFESLGLGFGGFPITGAPPDTTLAVGPNHIVAWVNSQFAIFNKNGVRLLPAPGFLDGNTIFSSLGAASLCATTNRGDPLVQYDRRADRWIFSQFAFNSGFASNSQCIAVSTTNDPLGSFNLYEYNFGNVLPDYGKLGIWNDGYYISYNMFTTGSSFAGGRACSYNRTAMLAGTPSPQICFNSTTRFSMLPADLDGATLPTDTTRGGLFLDWNWAFAAITPYTMRISRLKPDFVTPANSTFTDGFGGATFSFIPFVLPAADIASCADNGNACVPQLGTAQLLDTVGTRHMYRLAYRNRGGVDSLVFTQSLDPPGAGVAALRWYEIRNPLGNPADTNTSKRPFLYQNSTFAPTADSRWLGSAAMNKYGDIMAGYSISSSTTVPSIAVAGRSQCDPLNTLQAESIAHAGGGSQTTTLSRWGDYSTMQVDPADDQTFWYTTQYLGSNGTFNWRTRIVSYKFPTTTASADGDFGVAANWSNGVPNSTTTGIVPSGRTLTVGTASTVCSLDIQPGGSLVMNANLDVLGSLTLGTQINTGANTLGLGCNATVSGASTFNYVIGNVRKDFCATGGFSYPTGTANGYSPVNANVTATTNPSSLLIKANQGNKAGMAAANSLQRFWTLTNSAGTLTTDMVFNYNDPLDVAGTESSYKLYRFTGATGTDQTPITLDTTANTLSKTGISSFSDWAVGNLAPTAASATVTGRVLTSSGRGVSRASVSITDSDGQIRYTSSNSFGYYRFDNLATGQNYVISVRSKRYQFGNATQSIFVGEDLAGVDFTALP